MGDRTHAGSGNRGPRVDYSGTQAAASDQIIERIAWLMDGSIPLPGGYRIGLDPIVGLIPGVGDLIGAVVSSTIVFQAHKAGIPKPTLMRMVANVGIDAAVGAIPIFGDMFDFWFKVNRKNLHLYRQARAGTGSAQRDAAFLAVLALVLGTVFALPILVVVWVIRAVFPA